MVGMIRRDRQPRGQPRPEPTPGNRPGSRGAIQLRDQGRSLMRKFFVIVAGALMAALIPSSATIIGLGSLAAAVSLVASSEAAADTAVLPGWRHPCGRNPRCHERVV